MQADIREIFYETVKAFGASEGLPVSLPGVPFDPPGGREAEYIKAAPLPVKPIKTTMCGEARYRWLLQVSLFARDGVGDVRTSHHADKLHEQTFPIYSELVGNQHTYQVIEPPFASPSVTDIDGWFSIPVTFTVQTIH